MRNRSLLPAAALIVISLAACEPDGGLAGVTTPSTAASTTAAPSTSTTAVTTTTAPATTTTGPRTARIEADGSGGYPEVAAAIADLAPGSTVVLGPGTHRVGGPLEIAGDLTIIGEGAGASVLESTAAPAAVTFDGGGTLTLEALTVSYAGDDPADALVVLGGEV